MDKSRKPAKTNPFKPASGTMPPHLAGRRDEQIVFRACMDCLLDKGAQPAGPMVLFGPRGNGKTALLLRMSSIAAKRGVRPFRLTKQQLETPYQLAAHLTAMAKGDNAIDTSKAPEPMLESALRQLARKKPVLLLIDEAHTLPSKTGDYLLNAEQIARTEGANIQMVLAGAPNLQDALHDMDATFWGRLSKRRRPLGLLGRKDSLAAIAIPMRTSIDAKAANLIMRETSGYPYFLQDMGQALWDSGHPATKPIDVEAVRKALPAFTESRSSYYEDRLNDLHRDGLLLAAGAVAETAQAQGGFAALTSSDIEAACERSRARSHKSAEKLFEGLVHAGFLWADEQSKDRMDPFAVPPWSCGIPTLSQAASRRVRALWPDAHAQAPPPKRRAEAIREQDDPQSAVDAGADADQDADRPKGP